MPQPHPRPTHGGQVQFHAGDGRLPRPSYHRVFVYELSQDARDRAEVAAVHDGAARYLAAAVAAGHWDGGKL